ncbi:hypothetical protein [Undibacterium terreum]|uniref:Uncharacterized protein n=1 Tax=Undibacterium terreum TaxID=1224302 RepID=A0A916UQA0_9BURK|nr:hypothetical protein [Undibacterium terreum]GGC83054.1 hypothetical protein GCM10011396_33010 [Undibacterium terreum]
MSLSAFIQHSINAIAGARSFDEAIAMSRFLGELLWKNSMGQYELAQLEFLLLQKYKEEFAQIPAPAHRCEYLHVLTKAYDTGGHTRIVEHLLSSTALSEAAVLVTEELRPNAKRKLSAAKHGCTLLPRQKAGRQKILQLIALFAQHTTVILHIHPYDIDAVFAAAVAKHYFGTRIYLYNHADHVFSYGHGIADRVLEVSYFGWALRARRNIQDKSVFAGIPLKLPKGNIASASAPIETGSYLASAGTAYKYKPNKEFSFPRFALEYAKIRQDRLILIGPKLWSNWWWWKVWMKLKSRVEFHARMPHDKYLAFLSQAKAYVDSFPLTGGTAFPEIFSLGIPSFGVLTGSHGYSPADQLKSPSIDALIRDLSAFLAAQQNQRVETATILAQIHEVHSIENVADRIRYAYDLTTGQKQPPWDNPGIIDNYFYEKIWMSGKKLFLPVHTVPSLKLVSLFWKYRKQARFEKE